MQPTSTESSKQDHQEAQSTFMDNCDRYTTELLDLGMSPLTASGTPILMVSIALM